MSDWKILKLGSKFQIESVPLEFFDPEFYIDSDTLSTYEFLVKCGMVLTVSRVDKDGFPWVEFDRELDDGSIEKHSLFINHGGISLIANQL